MRQSGGHGLRPVAARAVFEREETAPSVTEKLVLLIANEVPQTPCGTRRGYRGTLGCP